jgi:transposase InsO family protein
MAPLSHPLQFLLVSLAGWINQHQRDVIDYLRTENRVLREQLGPRRLRFTDDQRIRLAAKAKDLRRQALREIGSIVSPDTLLAWHRHLIAWKYDGGQRRRPGRPLVMAEIRQLVVRMATESREWGYTRIQGALANVGHGVGRGTIAAILSQHGIEPARLPPRSPNLNAHAERYVRTIKEACLNRLIFVGEHSLRRAIAEFVAHYHYERNHQGRGNQLLISAATTRT